MRDYNQRQNGIQKEKVMQPLSLEYRDPKELYLPEGIANHYAKKFKNISNHQLRKILDTVKIAIRQSRSDDFKGARKQMFVLVAMSAYNAGRLKKLEPLYNFMKNTISENTIQTKEDIETFDQLFTSIVAYHKIIEGGEK